MKAGQKTRAYFKQDILNLVLDNYFNRDGSSTDMSRLLGLYEVCLYCFKKNNNLATFDKANIEKVDEYFEKCLDSYDAETWLRLAMECLTVKGYWAVLHFLMLNEKATHQEEIEFVL